LELNNLGRCENRPYQLHRSDEVDKFRLHPDHTDVKISVIVPAYNEEKLLGASLRSIQEAMKGFASFGWETELIVCNNNSTDRTGEIAAAAGANVVFEPINQIGRARNCGAKAATGDWLVFVDADSNPSRELFIDVAETIRTGRYLAGGSTVQLDTFHPVMTVGSFFWNIITRCKKWVAGAFIFCEANAFREIGGFDTEFYVAEEINLSNRLNALAKKRKSKLKILWRHPLLTSARKAKLYSSREMLRFFVATIFSPNETMRDPKRCDIWYDGRR
jgi:glycosyltransferase involved in cell wall biosynthesis